MGTERRKSGYREGEDWLKKVKKERGERQFDHCNVRQ